MTTGTTSTETNEPSDFLAVVQDDGWWHAVLYRRSPSDVTMFKARAKKERCKLARFPTPGGFSDNRAYLDMSTILETLWEPKSDERQA